MIIPMLCVTIFVILVVWFLLPRVARLMIHTPTAISIFLCLSMVQLMAVFISMRCTLCGHFLQVALTLILVVGYAIAASYIACKIRGLMVTVCPSQFATRRTLFHVLVGCGLLMLKVSRLKLPVIWLLVSMWLNTRGFGPLLEDKLCLIFKLAPSVCRMTFPILASLLVRLVVLLPFQLLRLSLATPSRWTPLALSVFLHCVVALLLTLL